MPYIGRSSNFGVRTRFLYTATASQTSFTGADTQNLTLSYSDSNFIDVHQNGVLLKVVDDYTATTGTSVVLATGATASDVIEITVYDVFSIANHIKKTGDAMAGPLTNIDIEGTELILDVDGDTSITADTDDQIDIKIAGADDFQFTANTFTAQSGSGVVIPEGGLTLGSTAISSTAAEINYNDISTLGTSAASKTLTADANGLTKITGAVLNVEDTLTDQATIAWDVIASPVAKVTLGANRTIAAPSGTTPAAGQFIALTVIQDGTGSRTLTWNATYEFTADTAPTLTTTANKGDLFIFKYNGSKWLEVGRNLALTLS